MLYKWIGAILIISGCGGFGFSIASVHRRDEHTLRLLVSALDYMECELQFRMTPLPDLCRMVSSQTSGYLHDIFFSLADSLDMQLSPDVNTCMNAVIRQHPLSSPTTVYYLQLLGTSLGRFDLNGQLLGLESVRSSCRKTLDEMGKNRENRLRSYQTLGLCGGAALVILFI